MNILFNDLNKNEIAAVFGGNFAKKLGKKIADANHEAESFVKDLRDKGRGYLNDFKTERNKERDKKDIKNPAVPAESEKEEL